MQPAERNYEIYDKKLLTIVEALTKWRQYLLDAMESFEVWTDHKNLKYFQEPHKLNRQQAQWYLKLQDYDFTLKYILGKTNMKVDILSWKDQVNIKKDNKDVQLLKEQLWTRRMTVEIMMLKRKMIVDELDIVKEIKRYNTWEQEVVQALNNEDRLTWKEDGIVYMEGKIYVSNNNKTREKILKKNHDSIDVGHTGQQRMLELIKQNY